MPASQDRLVVSAEQFRAAAAAVCDTGGICEPNLARLQQWLAGPAWLLAAEQQRRLTLLVDNVEPSDG